MENRAFLEMLRPARERILRRDIQDMVQKSDIPFDTEKSEFLIRTLGMEMKASYPSCELSEELEAWHTLLLWHYLDMADGTPLSGEWVTFGNLKDGLVRGTKYDRTVSMELEKLLKGKSREQILSVCEQMGAQFLQVRADISAVLWLFPRYPMLLNIWLEDEEFPASGKLLVDKHADHYLTIEDAVTAGEVVLSRWKQIMK